MEHFVSTIKYMQWNYDSMSKLNQCLMIHFVALPLNTNILNIYSNLEEKS